jgi:hypothetical protein
MYTKSEAIEALRDRFALAPGDTVYTILRHVSASGLTRHISPVVVRDDIPHDISYLVAAATERAYRVRGHEGIKIEGAGMDMGFELVYTLARIMWAEGAPCTGKERCPSNDHVNDHTMGYDPAIIHRDGGYALRQRWL